MQDFFNLLVQFNEPFSDLFPAIQTKMGHFKSNYMNCKSYN